MKPIQNFALISAQCLILFQLLLVHGPKIFWLACCWIYNLNL